MDPYRTFYELRHFRTPDDGEPTQAGWNRSFYHLQTSTGVDVILAATTFTPEHYLLFCYGDSPTPRGRSLR